jgi:ATP-dependent DNA ligase
MLCKSIDQLPPQTGARSAMSYEPKFDGRGLIGVDARGAAQIRSRHGTDLTTAFGDIAVAAAQQLPAGTW